MFSSLSSQQRWCYICLCFQALYVVIWYCCLRNQLRGVFKESFAIPSVPPPIELRDDMFRDSPSPGHSISSLKRSGMRNSPDDPVRHRKRHITWWQFWSKIFSKFRVAFCNGCRSYHQPHITEQRKVRGKKRTSFLPISIVFLPFCFAPLSTIGTTGTSWNAVTSVKRSINMVTVLTASTLPKHDKWSQK